MTAMASEWNGVRELSDLEIEAVAGGPVWVPIIVGAMILGGCASTHQRRNEACEQDPDGTCPVTPDSNPA